MISGMDGVTRLNIAQVKQKYGLIERENYNKPKSKDSRQPGCPEGRKRNTASVSSMKEENDYEPQ
jgi:hypothetical protein